MKKWRNGISLTNLIVWIVVMVIIAITILVGAKNIFGKATLSKFVSEFSDYSSAVTKKYNDVVMRTAQSKDGKTKEVIYYEIATNTTLAKNESPVPVGAISDFEIEIEPFDGLKGTNYFEILDDSTLTYYGYKSNKFFYGKNKYQEKHYVTDEGVVFTLPGFYINDNGVEKYYINERTYYTGEKLNGKGNMTNYVKVGDYINYIPESGTYVATANRTGSSLDQTLYTTGYASWRVWDISKKGVVSIVPCGTVNSLSLDGSVGYLNGIDELNNICSTLYSNESLNATARSMTAEDIESKATYNKRAYVKDKSYGAITSYTSGTHYAYEKDDKTVYEKIEASTNEKVNVKQTEYAYYPINWKKVDNQSNLYGDILGSGYSWLATRCTGTSSDKAYYGLHIVNYQNIEYNRLCDSKNETKNESNFAIRPIVKLDIATNVIVDGKNDGSSSMTAWKLLLEK